MTIVDAHMRNFDKLVQAIGFSEACLAECTETATGKPAAVICAINRRSGGVVELVPFAKMVEGDPYKEFLPPGATEEDKLRSILNEEGAPPRRSALEEWVETTLAQRRDIHGFHAARLLHEAAEHEPDVLVVHVRCMSGAALHSEVLRVRREAVKRAATPPGNIHRFLRAEGIEAHVTELDSEVLVELAEHHGWQPASVAGTLQYTMSRVVWWLTVRALTASLAP